MKRKMSWERESWEESWWSRINRSTKKSIFRTNMHTSFTHLLILKKDRKDFRT